MNFECCSEYRLLSHWGTNYPETPLTEFKLIKFREFQKFVFLVTNFQAWPQLHHLPFPWSHFSFKSTCYDAPLASHPWSCWCCSKISLAGYLTVTSCPCTSWIITGPFLFIRNEPMGFIIRWIPYFPTPQGVRAVDRKYDSFCWTLRLLWFSVLRCWTETILTFEVRFKILSGFNLKFWNQVIFR